MNELNVAWWKIKIYKISCLGFLSNATFNFKLEHELVVYFKKKKNLINKVVYREREKGIIVRFKSSDVGRKTFSKKKNGVKEGKVK